MRSQRKQFVYPENEKRGESIQCHAVLWICNGDVVWLFLIAELLAPDKLQKRSFCQFNAMLCYGFAMEALFGCFLLQRPQAAGCDELQKRSSTTWLKNSLWCKGSKAGVRSRVKPGVKRQTTDRQTDRLFFLTQGRWYGPIIGLGPSGP